MAVEFNGSTQYIEYASILINQATRSASVWFYLDDVTSKYNVLIRHIGQVWNLTGVDNAIQLVHLFSVDDSSATVSGILTVGGWHNIAFTYDASNTTNQPIIYFDSVVQALDTPVAPTGVIGADPGGILYIGGHPDFSTYTVDGKIQDVRIYNRILSADEVAELYNSRMQNKILNGLVFWSRLDGAKGLTKFDGTTLGTANTFIDEIGGAIGTPSGSPIGRGNTIQRVK